MMLRIALFELRYRLRQASPYVFFAVLFITPFLLISTDAIRTAGGSSRTIVNSPLFVVFISMTMMLLGTLMATAITGTAIYRDFEHRTHELFFTTGVSRAAYFGGRFLGSYAVALLVFSGAVLGALFGAAAPWLDRDQVGPFLPAGYLQAMFVFLAPNLFVISAIFFVLGALTRSLVALYVQGIVLLVAYAIALTMLAEVDNLWFGSLLDPFGIVAVRASIRYWTQTEARSSFIPVAGYLLWNRALWLGIGAATLAAGYRFFHFSAQLSGPRIRLPREDAAPVPPFLTLTAPAIEQRFRPETPWRQLVSLTRLYLTEMGRGAAYRVIVLSGMVLLVVLAANADTIYGTHVYPVTRVMVASVTENFILFLVILLTLYAGELTWKERVLELDQIQDSMPVPTPVVVLSKLAAVVVMQARLLLALALTGMVIQAFKGYFRFEPGLYFGYIYLTLFPSIVGLTVFAFFVHGLVNNRFLGHTFVVLFYVCEAALPAMGLEHNLYSFWGMPGVKYSDMNGYGPFAAPTFWFSLYWTALTVLLGIAAIVFWVRGVDLQPRARVALARARWSPSLRQAARLSAAAAIAIGGFIFYNTNVLNEFRTEKEESRRTAEYEKRYKRYERMPIPRIEDVKLRVDLYPERRQYALRGVYRMRNKTGERIDVVPVNYDDSLKVRSFTFDRPAARIVADHRLGFYIYRLSRPLEPGESLTLTFDIAYDRTGFENDHLETAIAANGSFLSGQTPSIGYLAEAELDEPKEREKHGLPKKRRMPPLSDERARENSYLANDADWVSFDATISTAPDQIAIAPGYLQKEWTEGGRRLFHYRMDAPIRRFYSFLSARYRVYRSRWKDVAIEIYHHPTHTYNLARMARAVQRSLEYCSKSFSPYQYRQLRIVEFPCYQDFAQSFPNTVPYSEGIGFIARVREKRDIDYPFYVTAHEVAHQWWAHQIVSADTEGAEMLTESLAQYSALMVMEREFGRSHIRRFLRYELDTYLQGRGAETEEEEPLMLVQRQPYIHYNKASLVFYALKDAIGEQRLNRVLARFLRERGHSSAPYPTSEELVARIRAETPPDQRGLVTDLFERIILFDISVTSAKSEPLPGGRYRVTLKVSAAKMEADGQGNESPLLLDDCFDIGLFAGPSDGEDLGRPILMTRKTLRSLSTTLTFRVPERPALAVIDPYGKLPDRKPEDNVRPVQEASGEGTITGRAF